MAHSAGLGSDEPNNIDIYKASKDSVVYITSTVYQRDFFFGVQEVQDLGSGFIINADGQILTNYHVISGSSDMEVTCRRIRAAIKRRCWCATGTRSGADQDRRQEELTSLKLGDSDRLQVGPEGAGHRQSVRTGRHA